MQNQCELLTVSLAAYEKVLAEPIAREFRDSATLSRDQTTAELFALTAGTS
jgi:hypothetical protein